VKKTSHAVKKTSHRPQNLIYQSSAIDGKTRRELVSYLESLQPLWEMRYSASHPPPPGDQQRRLLRPVYWLGHWQFACLNYYHPPKGIDHRCVEAEPFPSVMQELVGQIEEQVRQNFSQRDIPRGWHLNTCLINYYGSQNHNGKWTDTARVGEHKDFEPGPVASVSFGERALFQFVKSQGRDRQQKSEVVLQQWLEDSSLQIFGGDKFKKQLFHRVQRVEDKGQIHFKIPLEDFKTRRINLTFRYVPLEHIRHYREFPMNLREDITPYIQTLAARSSYFQSLLKTSSFS